MYNRSHHSTPTSSSTSSTHSPTIIGSVSFSASSSANQSQSHTESSPRNTSSMSTTLSASSPAYAAPPSTWVPPKVSGSNYRSAFLSIVNFLHSRKHLPFIIGLITAAVLFYVPLITTPHYSTLLSSRRLHLSTARHDFAYTALYGRSPHLRYSFPVNDHTSLINSFAVQLTHSTRRAISIAYTKNGKADYLAPKSGVDSGNWIPTKELHRWSRLYDGGSHAGLDLGLGTGLDLVRDYTSFPSKLPVFLSLPFSVGADGVSAAEPAAKAEAFEKERVLCFYVFSATDTEYVVNLRNFISRVVRAHHPIDYVFLINQIEGRVIDIAGLPKLPPNARYIQHRNECYDWGTIGWILDIQDEIDTLQNGQVDSPYWLNLSQYKYFIIMNSSVRGPWLPSYIDVEDPRNVWYAPLMRQLQLSPAMRLVGPVQSCQIQPHLQSYILLTDVEGLHLLRTHKYENQQYQDRQFVRVNDYNNLGKVRDAARMNSKVVGQVGACEADPKPIMSVADLAGNGVFGCHSALEQAILEAELGASKTIIESGYNLGSLARMYSGVDFRAGSYQRCFEMRDNPSDGPLMGHIVKHGPFSPRSLDKRREDQRRQAELSSKHEQEAEYKDILEKAAKMAEHRSKNKAMTTAIASLLLAMPSVTTDDSPQSAPLFPSNLSPSAAYLAHAQYSVDSEPIFLDPLEILFGKFKQHKKFPPKHIANYYGYATKARERRVKQYVRQHLVTRQREWESQFENHRLRHPSASDVQRQLAIGRPKSPPPRTIAQKGPGFWSKLSPDNSLSMAEIRARAELEEAQQKEARAKAKYESDQAAIAAFQQQVEAFAKPFDAPVYVPRTPEEHIAAAKKEAAERADREKASQEALEASEEEEEDDETTKPAATEVNFSDAAADDAEENTPPPPPKKKPVAKGKAKAKGKKGKAKVKTKGKATGKKGKVKGKGKQGKAKNKGKGAASAVVAASPKPVDTPAEVIEAVQKDPASQASLVLAQHSLMFSPFLPPVSLPPLPHELLSAPAPLTPKEKLAKMIADNEADIEREKQESEAAQGGNDGDEEEEEESDNGASADSAEVKPADRTDSTPEPLAQQPAASQPTSAAPDSSKKATTTAKSKPKAKSKSKSKTAAKQSETKPESR